MLNKPSCIVLCAIAILSMISFNSNAQSLNDPITPTSVFDDWCNAHTTENTVRDEWIVRYCQRYVDMQRKYFEGNSDNLAWNGSRALQSLLDMYEVTSDTAFLYEFVARANEVYAQKQQDTYIDSGNQYDGWGFFDNSEDLIKNGSFDGDGPGNNPEYWDEYDSQYGADTKRVGSGCDTGEDYCARIYSPGDGVKRILQTNTQNTNSCLANNAKYEPDSTYQLSYCYKTEDPGGVIQVHDSTTNMNITTKYLGYNLPWTCETLEFVTPSATDHDLQIRIRQRLADEAGYVWFDNVSLKQYAEKVVHEGLISSALGRYVAIIEKWQSRCGANCSTPSALQGPADDYSSLISNHIFPKWHNSNTWITVTSDRAYFKARDDGSTSLPNDMLPHNQYLAMASAYAWMGAALGNSTYADRAHDMFENFEYYRQTDSSGPNYEWKYRKALSCGSANYEDRDHAETTTSQVYTAKILGYDSVFSDTSMPGFPHALSENMWNGNSNHPQFSYQVDGSGDSTGDYQNLIGWALLSPWANAEDVWGVVQNTLNEDPLSDGTKTWETMKSFKAVGNIAGLIKTFGIVNGGFEVVDPNDDTLPMYWYREGCDSSVCYVSASSASTGDFKGKVETDGSWNWLYIRLNYRPGETHKVSFYGKVSGAISGRVEVRNETDSINIDNISFSGTSYGYHSFTFNAPSTPGKELVLRFGPNSNSFTAGSSVFVDDVLVDVNL